MTQESDPQLAENRSLNTLCRQKDSECVYIYTVYTLYTHNYTHPQTCLTFGFGGAKSGGAVLLPRPAVEGQLDGSA